MTDQQTLTEQYDEVERDYTEALYAILSSRRSSESKDALLKKLCDGHGNAATAAAQLEAIRLVLKELEG
jgi:hypothetical protein